MCHSLLGAAVYQVLIQSKIITTAIFSAILLKKNPSAMQWLSVCGLFFGVAIVQLSFGLTTTTSHTINYAIGLLSIIISTFTSGFAGVYFEKVMKSSKLSMWTLNVQMSFVSIIIALATCFGKDSQIIMAEGFFRGYDPMVLAVIFLQVFFKFYLCLRVWCLYTVLAAHYFMDLHFLYSFV